MRALLLLPVLLLGGCLAYNDDCAPRVNDPKGTVGYLAAAVPLDKLHARHANNALGQLAAEAFLHSQDGTSAPAELGIENGGAIRAEGVCPGTSRTQLPPGPVERQALFEIFLFENLVVTVNLTEPELLAVMEHSVEALVPSSQTLITASGQFLHLAGGTMTVDCNRTPGQRVVSLTVGGRPVAMPGRPEVSYRVAASSYLLGGGDGYSMLVGLDGDFSRNPAQAGSGGTEARVISSYFEKTYASPSPGFAVDEGRIVLQNCAKP